MTTHVPGLVTSGDYFQPRYSWLVSDIEKVLHVTVQIDLAAVDPDLPATYPAGLLRSGLILGKVTATGVYKEYDDGDSDGTEVATGILLHPVYLRNPLTKAAFASGTKVFGEMVVGNAIVDGSGIDGSDGNLDANGRTDLRALGIKFSDEV